MHISFLAEVVFFLLGALAIVEIMDAHKGFDNITKAMTQHIHKTISSILKIT